MVSEPDELVRWAALAASVAGAIKELLIYNVRAIYHVHKQVFCIWLQQSFIERTL